MNVISEFGSWNDVPRHVRRLCTFVLATTLALVAQSSPQNLSNNDIVLMVQAKISDNVIVAKIRSSPSRFDTSPTALIQLKQAGVSDLVLQAMTEAAAVGSTRADIPLPSAGPALPSSFGIYLSDGLTLKPLQASPVETRIGLVAGAGIGGQNGFAVDGFVGDPNVAVSSVAPAVIAYGQNIDTGTMHLSKLTYVSAMQAYQFNMIGTQPAFFRNVYGKNYNDVVQVGLWRPQGEIALRVEPVAAKPGMYRLVPSSSLTPGRYAFYKTGAVHDERLIFASPPARQSDGFYFEVTGTGAGPTTTSAVGNANAAMTSNFGQDQPISGATGITAATGQGPNVSASRGFPVSHRHIVLFAPGPVTDQCSGILTVSPDGTVTYQCTQADPHGRCDKYTLWSGTLEAQVRRGGNLHIVASRHSYDFYGDQTVIQEAYNAISSPSGAQLSGPASAVGKYVGEKSANDVLDLHPDQTFSLVEAGKTYSGSYLIAGTTLILNFKEMNGRAIAAVSTGKLDGNELTDDGGKHWAKQAAASAPSQ